MDNDEDLGRGNDEVINECMDKFFSLTSLPYGDDGKVVGAISGVAFTNTKNHGSATLADEVTNITPVTKNRTRKSQKSVDTVDETSAAETPISAEFAESSEEEEFYNILYDGQVAKDEQPRETSGSHSSHPSLGKMFESETPSEPFGVNELPKNYYLDIDPADPEDFVNLVSGVADEQLTIFDMTDNSANNYDLLPLLDESSATESRLAKTSGELREDAARPHTNESVSRIDLSISVDRIGKLQLSKPSEEQKQRKHPGPRSNSKHSRSATIKAKQGSKHCSSSAEDLEIPKLHPSREVRNMVPCDEPPVLEKETVVSTTPTQPKALKKISWTMASPAGDDHSKKVTTLDGVPEIPENHLANKSAKPLPQEQSTIVCRCGSSKVCLVHNSLPIIAVQEPIRTPRMSKRTFSQSSSSKSPTVSKPGTKATCSDKNIGVSNKKSDGEVKCDLISSQSILAMCEDISDDELSTPTTAIASKILNTPGDTRPKVDTIPQQKTAASKSVLNSVKASIQKSSSKATARASAKSVPPDHSSPNTVPQIVNNIDSLKAVDHKRPKVSAGLSPKKSKHAITKHAQSSYKVPAARELSSSNSQAADEISANGSSPVISPDDDASCKITSQCFPIGTEHFKPATEVVSSGKAGQSIDIVAEENVTQSVDNRRFLELSTVTKDDPENSITPVKSNFVPAYEENPKKLKSLPVNRSEQTVAAIARQETNFEDRGSTIDIVPTISNSPSAMSSKVLIDNKTSEIPCVPGDGCVGESSGDSLNILLAKKCETVKDCMDDQQLKTLTKSQSRLVALEKRMRTSSAHKEPNSPKSGGTIHGQSLQKTISSSPKKPDLKIVVSLPKNVASQVSEPEPGTILNCSKPKKYRCWTGTSKSLVSEKTKPTKAYQVPESKSSNIPGTITDDGLVDNREVTSFSDKRLTNSALPGSFLEKLSNLNVTENPVTQETTNSISCASITEPEVGPDPEGAKEVVIIGSNEDKNELSSSHLACNLEEYQPHLGQGHTSSDIMIPPIETTGSTDQGEKISLQQKSDSHKETVNSSVEFAQSACDLKTKEMEPKSTTKSESKLPISEGSTISPCLLKDIDGAITDSQNETRGDLGLNCSAKSQIVNDSVVAPGMNDGGVKSRQKTLSESRRITRLKLTRSQPKAISDRSTKIVLLAESQNYQGMNDSNDLTSALKDNLVNESKARKSAFPVETSPRKLSVYDFTPDDDICKPVTTYQSRKDGGVAEKLPHENCVVEDIKTLIISDKKGAVPKSRKKLVGVKESARSSVKETFASPENVPSARALRYKRKSEDASVSLDPVSSEESETEIKNNREIRSKDMKPKNLDETKLGLDTVAIEEPLNDKNRIKTRSSLKSSDKNPCKEVPSKYCSKTDIPQTQLRPKLRSDVSKNLQIESGESLKSKNSSSEKLSVASNRQGVTDQIICPAQNNSGCLQSNKSHTKAPKTLRNSALSTNKKVNNDHSLMESSINAPVSLITPMMESGVAQLSHEPDEMHDVPQHAEPEGAKGSSPKSNDNLNEDAYVFKGEPIKKLCEKHNNHVLRSTKKNIANNTENLRINSKNPNPISGSSTNKQLIECKSYAPKPSCTKAVQGSSKNDIVNSLVYTVQEPANDGSHTDNSKRFTRSLYSLQPPGELSKLLVKVSQKSYSNPKKRKNYNVAGVQHLGSVDQERVNSTDVVSDSKIVENVANLELSPKIEKSSSSKEQISKEGHPSHVEGELPITRQDNLTSAHHDICESSLIEKTSDEELEKGDFTILSKGTSPETTTKAVCTLSGLAEKLMEEISNEEIPDIDQVSVPAVIVDQTKEGNDDLKQEPIVVHGAEEHQNVPSESCSTDLTVPKNFNSSKTVIDVIVSVDDSASDSLVTPCQSKDILKPEEPKALEQKSSDKHAGATLDSSTGSNAINIGESAEKIVKGGCSQVDVGSDLDLTKSTASVGRKFVKVLVQRRSESNCILLPLKRRKLKELNKSDTDQQSALASDPQSSHPTPIISYPIISEAGVIKQTALSNGIDTSLNPDITRIASLTKICQDSDNVAVKSAESQPSSTPTSDHSVNHILQAENKVVVRESNFSDSYSERKGQASPAPPTSDHSVYHILQAGHSKVVVRGSDFSNLYTEQRGYNAKDKSTAGNCNKNSVSEVIFGLSGNIGAERTISTSCYECQTRNIPTRRSSVATSTVICPEWNNQVSLFEEGSCLWMNRPSTTSIHVNTSAEEEPSPEFSPNSPDGIQKAYLTHTNFTNESNIGLLTTVPRTSNRQDKTKVTRRYSASSQQVHTQDDAMNLTVHANHPKRMPGIDVDHPPSTNRKKKSDPQQRLRPLQKSLSEKGQFEPVSLLQCDTSKSELLKGSMDVRKSIPQRPVARRASDVTQVGRGSPGRLHDAYRKDSVVFRSCKSKQSAQLKQQKASNLETIVGKVSNHRQAELSSSGTLQIVPHSHGQRCVGNIPESAINVNTGSVLIKQRTRADSMSASNAVNFSVHSERKSKMVSVVGKNLTQTEERQQRVKDTQSLSFTRPLSPPIVVIDSDDEACPQTVESKYEVENEPTYLGHAHSNEATGLEETRNSVMESQTVTNKGIVDNTETFSSSPTIDEPVFFDELDVGSEVQIGDSSIRSIPGSTGTGVGCFSVSEQSIIPQTTASESANNETNSINPAFNPAVPNGKPAVIVEQIETHRDVSLCGMAPEDHNVYSAQEVEIRTSLSTEDDCNKNPPNVLEEDTPGDTMVIEQTSLKLEIFKSIIDAELRDFQASLGKVDIGTNGDAISSELENDSRCNTESNTVEVDVSNHLETIEICTAEITSQIDKQSSDLTEAKNFPTSTTLSTSSDADKLNISNTSMDSHPPKKSAAELLVEARDESAEPLEKVHSTDAIDNSAVSEVNVNCNSEISPSENCTDLGIQSLESKSKSENPEVGKADGSLPDTTDDFSDPKTQNVHYFIVEEIAIDSQTDKMEHANPTGESNSTEPAVNKFVHFPVNLPDPLPASDGGYESDCVNDESSVPNLSPYHPLVNNRKFESLTVELDNKGQNSSTESLISLAKEMPPQLVLPCEVSISHTLDHTEGKGEDKERVSETSIPVSTPPKEKIISTKSSNSLEGEISSQLTAPCQVLPIDVNQVECQRVGPETVCKTNISLPPLLQEKECTENEISLNHEVSLESEAPCQTSITSILNQIEDQSEDIIDELTNSGTNHGGNTHGEGLVDAKERLLNDVDISCTVVGQSVCEIVDAEVPFAENTNNQKELDKCLLQPSDSVADPGINTLVLVQNETSMLIDHLEDESKEVSHSLDKECPSNGVMPVCKISQTEPFSLENNKKPEELQMLILNPSHTTVETEISSKDLLISNPFTQNEGSKLFDCLEQQPHAKPSLKDEECSFSPTNEVGSQSVPEESGVNKKEPDSCNGSKPEDPIIDPKISADDRRNHTEIQLSDAVDVESQDKEAAVENSGTSTSEKKALSITELKSEGKTIVEDTIVSNTVDACTIPSQNREPTEKLCSLPVDVTGTGKNEQHLADAWSDDEPTSVSSTEQVHALDSNLLPTEIQTPRDKSIETLPISITKTTTVLNSNHELSDSIPATEVVEVSVEDNNFAEKNQLASYIGTGPSPGVNNADILTALTPSPSSDGSCSALKDSPEIEIDDEPSSPPNTSSEHRLRRGVKRERISNEDDCLAIGNIIEKKASTIPQVVLERLNLKSIPQTLQISPATLRELQSCEFWVGKGKESEPTISVETEKPSFVDLTIERCSLQLSPVAKVPKLVTVPEIQCQKGQKRTFDELQGETIRKNFPFAFVEPSKSVPLETNGRIMEYLKRNKKVELVNQKVPYFKEFKSVLPEPLENWYDEKSENKSALRQLVERTRSRPPKRRTAQRTPSSRVSSPILISSNSEDSLPEDDDPNQEANEIDGKSQQKVGSRIPYLYDDPDGSPVSCGSFMTSSNRAFPCRTERSNDLGSFSSLTTFPSSSFNLRGASSFPTVLGEPRRNLQGEQKVYVRPEVETPMNGDSCMVESPDGGRCAMLTATRTRAAILGTYHSAKAVSQNLVHDLSRTSGRLSVTLGDDGSLFSLPMSPSQSTSEGSVHRASRRKDKLAVQSPLVPDTTRSLASPADGPDFPASEDRHQVQTGQCSAEPEHSSSPSTRGAERSSGNQPAPRSDLHHYWNKFLASLPDDVPPESYQLFDKISRLIDGQPPAKKARDS